MITFKQYLAESALDAAIKIVKRLLGPNAEKLENFDDSVLDTAKREQQEFVDTGSGKLSVSVYKTRTTRIAQVSQPKDNHPLYFSEKQPA
jgi:hypothetical protein